MTYGGSTYAGSAYADSDASEPLTAREGAAVPSQGWHAEITHPTSGRVRTPDVLDLQSAPALNPGPNAQPTLRLPVRKDDVWLSDAYDDDPEMRVWRDGERLPIEVLRNVEQREDATVLVGVGGVELEGRVSEEYNDDRRHVAASNLVTTETSYASDAPEPDVDTLTNQSQQVVDSEAEWVAALRDENEDTDLWGVSSSGALRRRQTAYFADTDGLTDTRGTETFDSSGIYTYIDGDAWLFENPAVQNGVEAGVERTFSIDYQIPGSEVGVAVRMERPDDQGDGTAFHQAFDVRVNGETVGSAPADTLLVADPPRWYTTGNVPSAAGPGDVDVEVKFTADSSDADAETIIDAVMLYDRRHEPTLTDEVTQDSDRKAQVDLFNGSSIVQTDDVATAFSVSGGRVEATVNDTTGAQSVGVSNDGGNTWTDADNSATVETDFASITTTLRARFELGAYDGETATLVGQINGHEVDAYELFADIQQELLLIEETFDNDLGSVLTSIAEPAERSWRFAYDDGTPTVRFVQNGQFEADFAPEYEDRTREKLGKTYDSVTIKGSHEPVSNEPYTASTTFSDLARSNILPGSETVYDDATNYERGTDYEINYNSGELRATSGGSLTVGTDYRIDYRYQARGTYESDSSPADPDELVETVPGVTSERLAEQVGFVIQTDSETPRYAAEVTIPEPDPRFDPVDALPPEALGLPSNVGALEVRGEPELTERGLRVRFGTRPAVEQSIQRLSQQLSRVSDRS